MKRRQRDEKYGDHVYVPHTRNTRVMMPVVEQAPPPLPPRRHQPPEPNRPTVQVRPFSSKTDKHSSSGRGDSRSPSIAGSGKQWKRDQDERLGSERSSEMLVGPVRHRENGSGYRHRQRSEISDEEASSSSSDPRMNNRKNRARRTDRDKRSKRQDALTNLNQERNPLGNSIQCLPTTEEDRGWGDEVNSRIGAAVRSKQDGRLQIGDTVLSPVINDDDYMTMHPRRATDSAESQRKPLLPENRDNDSSEGHDGPLFERAPAPPAHKSRSSSSNFSGNNKPVSEMLQSRVYDDILDSEASTNGAGTTTGPNSEIVNLVLRKEISKDILDIDASENGDDLQT
ncbi:hypothetical protein WR25_24544 [Diploscapter pachys]|uniref:Uncharacterized protein n=1 Tax=Diploscapter pachys TaxID=2018661 RepID=A0A2A2KKB7_9BILA|nr:hypothetical protein WR25_24544 [Diploscapter pachys]